MTIGIVGHEAKKFTPETELHAKQIIANIIGNAANEDIDRAVAEWSDHIPGLSVVSGECHLGGVDIWAKERVEELRHWHEWITYQGYPPSSHTWESYKARNIQIAEASDVVHVIVVRELPPSFKGMKHALCYHCKTTDHVKSGGCWTAHYAMRHGKKGVWHVIG